MTRVLFVADQLSHAHRTRHDQYPGGAELTDDAALGACPWAIEPMTFRELSSAGARFLDAFDVIVVANSQTASPQVLRHIARTERHVLFEHDLRICRWRGNFPVVRDPWHRSGGVCWCPHLESRELFDRASGVIFLTALQERYYRANRYFASTRTRVLGCSLFERTLLEQEVAPTRSRHGTLVFASSHAIKGHRQALEYCEQRDIVPNPIRNLRPNEVIELFGRSERFVYLPIGPEWAGRMVVEARVRGCEVVASDLVGVTGEPFWAMDRDAAREFLLDGPRRFWRLVEELMNGVLARSVRRVTPMDRAMSAITWSLKRAPFRFWPVGADHGPLPPPRTFPPW